MVGVISVSVSADNAGFADSASVAGVAGRAAVEIANAWNKKC